MTTSQPSSPSHLPQPVAVERCGTCGEEITRSDDPRDGRPAWVHLDDTGLRGNVHHATPSGAPAAERDGRRAERAAAIVDELRTMQYRTEAVALLDELAALLTGADPDEAAHIAMTGETTAETRARLAGTVAEDVDHYDGLRDSVDPSLYPED